MLYCRDMKLTLNIDDHLFRAVMHATGEHKKSPAVVRAVSLLINQAMDQRSRQNLPNADFVASSFPLTEMEAVNR